MNDAMTGQQFNVPDAIDTFQLDGKGGLLPLVNNAIATEQHPFWLHLDYEHEASMRWIQSCSLLPPSVKDTLSGDSIRPRIARQGEGTLIVLRSINPYSDTLSDPLVTIRVYMTSQLIISSRHRQISAIKDLISDFDKNTGAINSGDWLVELADALTDHMSEFINDLHGKVIDLEDNLIDQRVPERGEIALIRKQLIILRRYLAPQRDVLSRLASERLPWMHDDDRHRMQEIADRLGRGLDDLDSTIARTAVLVDEISSQLADAMNRRTYIMSLLAMLFLPATLLTGLFGINVGGIPGANTPWGFVIFSLGLLGMIGGILFFLKRQRWL